MINIWFDIRYALRQLRHTPGFTFTAVAVLALGIGVNIAVFTILNGILLRPLPYAQPDRLVKVELSGGRPYYPLNYANILQLRDSIGPQLQIGATFGSRPASVAGPGGRFQVFQTNVDANLLPMLGAHPILGRVFRSEESDPGRNSVVLLGEDAWRKLFFADPQILGKTLTIRSHAHAIVGVMPRGFSFPVNEEMQIWTPLALTAANRSAMSGKEARFCEPFARLPEGMTAAQLTAALSRTQSIVAKEVSGDDVPTRVTVTGYQQSLSNNARKPLMLLYAVVIGIWALACLNVTSLMLARAVGRTREQAVRAALGASRARLLQQTVVESLLLSCIGGFFGLLLAQTAIKLLWRQIHRQLPLSSAIHVDWRVGVCLAVLTLFTALVAGVFPALRAMRRNVQGGLQGVTTTASGGQRRTREALVIAQLALTLVFLVGAGLFLRTIYALRHVPLGFTQQNVLTGGVLLNAGSGQTEEQMEAAAAQQPNIVRSNYLPLLERLQAIPGVQVVALSSVLPMRAEFGALVSGKLDNKETSPGNSPMIDARLASAGLVEAMGIPIVRGRFFTEDDTTTSPPVVVVNQAFANRYLRGQDPIGHTFGMGRGRFAEMHIVGVIGDVKQTKVTDATTPEMYFCLSQVEPGTPLYGIAAAFIQVAMRAAVPADQLRAQFDKALHEVAPDATTTDVKTIHEAVEESFGSQTLIARLLEAFAGLALLIASVGLYGLLSFTVAQRTREIGVRIALGAPQSNIERLILGRALLLVSAGLAIGGVLAWFTARFTTSYIYGVQTHDALTFAAVVLAAASFVAAWLPARRAASVDPILALRAE